MYCLPIIKYLDMYFILRPQINDFEYKECVGSTFYFPSIKALKNKIKIPEFVTLKKYVSGHLESFKTHFR